MPRYFFEAEDERGTTDRGDRDCPDNETAVQEAAQIASEIVRNPRARSGHGGAIIVTIRDQDRRPKAEFRLVYDVKWADLSMLCVLSAQAFGQSALLGWADSVV